MKYKMQKNSLWKNKMIMDISSFDKSKYFINRFKGGVVYKFTNIITNDIYIGSSINLFKRYYTHLHHMRTERKSCVRLNRAVNKYRECNFKFEIIAKCPIEYVIKLEQWFIDNLDPQYNIAKIAGSNAGIKRSDEVKLKQSNLQKKNWKDSDYRKYHLANLSLNWKSGKEHPFYGKNHTDETKERISKAKKGVTLTTKSKVINTETGEIYNSIVDCIRKNNLTDLLYQRLSGARINPTPFKYLNTKI